ncbi:MAG: 1-deoxy-D-xylulose-5-phosphate synthase, partial [Candidatus Omnitrophica bacterium CG07_land_8_20_14_0_80_50_8]
RPIEKGKAELLREGKDVVILALGSMVYTAYEVAELLDKEAIQAAVVNARFAKPLDAALILKLAQETDLVVTLEEGVLSGGFGSAVLELFASHHELEPMQIRPMGIPDRFIEHGRRDLLLDALGLSPRKIKEEIIGLLRLNKNSFASAGRSLKNYV